MLTRPHTSLLCLEIFYDSCSQEQVQTPVAPSPLHTQMKLPSLPGCAVLSIPLAPSPVHRLIPLPGTPFPSFSLNLSFRSQLGLHFLQIAVPGLQAGSGASSGVPSWACSISVLLMWVVAAPLEEWSCLLGPELPEDRSVSGSSWLLPPPTSRVSLCAPLSRFQHTAQVGEAAFLTVGPLSRG